MSWKETCVMDEKVRFIVECNESEESFAELCRRFGISRKTGYKWIERYQQKGAEGLMDQAPVARTRPHEREGEVIEAVVALRKEHANWGPKKLRGYLVDHQPQVHWPAASTIGDWLNKYGLVRRQRRRIRAPMEYGGQQWGKEPNQVWCADFKGWWVMGDSRKCYPLTITDECSRYLLKSEGMVQTTTKPVMEHFERAFREYGLPGQLKTDNGPPFASRGPGGLTALSVWWIKLGIVPVHIEPGEPQQNGRHERMHLTMEQDLLKPQADLLDQQRALDMFRREYNQERPHEALGQTPPARHYVASSRQMPAQPQSPAYQDMTVRWANSSGQISWRGRPLPVGSCLGGEPVGLRQISETGWEVRYGPVRLGVVDDRDEQRRLRPGQDGQ